MAYDDISVTSAKNAIINCKNSLNYTKSQAILSGLNVSTYWDAESRTTFSNGIDLLINTKYKDLETYLDKCLTSLDYIEEYKGVQSDVDYYNDQINRKNQELDNKRYRYYCLSNKNSMEAYRLKSEMNDLSNDIDDLEYERDNSVEKLQEIEKNIIV